ncbi:MAG: ABC transporter ATP-binding protein [Longimicrobiales bacterium]|nr:ABC transporter ATP-binding protein [Longimicrobiales bacterium]
MSIELVDIHKSFGDKEVLKGFSLTIQDGQTTSILGASGSGKSVTLKHIIGLLKPDRGEVWVDGENVSRLDQASIYRIRRKVGFVFQFAALFDSMTIADNVAMGLRRMEAFSDDEIRDRVEDCLERVDLAGYGDRHPAELSGGQRKRVGFARAIATEPKYLLYDEPTTGLDPITKAVIDQLIMKMADDLGVTGVVITHDMDSAFKISDRIAMLHEGKNRIEGTPDEIRATDDPVVKGFIEGRPELLETV